MLKIQKYIEIQEGDHLGAGNHIVNTDPATLNRYKHALAKIRASEHTLNGFISFLPNDQAMRNSLAVKTDLGYVAGLLVTKVDRSQEHMLQLFTRDELCVVIKKFATTKGLVKKAE